MRIDLPAILTAESLKEALSELPIVQRHEGRLYLKPTFRLQGGVDKVVISARKVVSATPESLVLLPGIVWWIRQSEAKTNIALTNVSHLAPIGLDSKAIAQRLDPPEIFRGPIGEAVHPIVCISVPRIRDLNDQAHVARSHKSIELLADQIVASVYRLIDAKYKHLIVEEALAEFVWESLLNVAEHAYASSTSASNPVWICASLTPAESSRRLYSTPSQHQSPSTNIASSWHHFHTRKETVGFFELAIFDAGLGVVQTLGNAYFKAHPKKKPRGSGARARYWLAHEEILLWALSPYGSRKQPGEHLTLLLREGWRGLYRIWYRLRRLDGFLSLGSGLGRVGTASAGGDHFQLRRSMLQDDATTRSSASGRKPDEIPWPGTMLVFRIALPIPSTPTVLQSFSPQSQQVAKVDEIVYIEPSARSFLDYPNNPTEKSIQAYRRVVDNLIQEKLNHAQATQNEKVQFSEPIRFIAIVHPAISLVSRLEGALHNTRRTPVQVKTLLDDSNEATLALLLLKDQGLPGIIPIDVFLGITNDGLRMAQAEFTASAKASGDQGEEAHPQILGVVRPADGSITWMIMIYGDNSEFELVERGLVVLDEGQEPPAWWLELEHLYPGVVTRSEDTANRRQALVWSLPQRFDASFYSGMLQHQLPLLAKYTKVDRRWFWESSSEFIRTEGGFLVRQFMSVYALCQTEPVIEQYLSLAVLSLLATLITPGQRVLLVPDRRTSSYLIARRILHHRNDSENVKVVHADDFHSVFRPSDAVVIFKDILFTDVSSQEMVEFLGGNRVAAVLACGDLRNEAEHSSGKEVPRRFAIFTWRFPPVLVDQNDRGSIRTVDPLTGELLSSSFEKQVHALLSLTWGPLWSTEIAPQPTPKAVLAQEAYTYGFQFTGGAYHVAKYSLLKAFDSEERTEEIERWLEGIFEAEISFGNSFDLLILVRDDLATHPAIRNRFRSIILNIARRRTDWEGKLYFGVIATARRSGRQLIRRGQKTLQDDITLIQESIGSKSQLSLFAQGGSAAVDPGKEFVAIYLDEAAVSGRTIRDLLLMLTGVDPPSPRAIHVCPVVDKLTPEDEELFNLVSFPWPSASALPSRQGRFYFHSFIQLRVPGYHSFETSRIFKVVRSLLEEVADLRDQDVIEWAESIQRQIELIMRRESGVLLQAPLYPGVQREILVSTDSLLLRHLLALHREAFPVLEKIVEVCTHMIRTRDWSLLLIFALEPDLLEVYPISGAFAKDIAELALEVLESQDPGEDGDGIRSNALLVLFCQPQAFRQNVRRIALASIGHKFLRCQWVVQMLFTARMHEPTVGQAIEIVEEHLLLDQSEAVSNLLDLLRAESIKPLFRSPPETLGEAEEAVLSLVKWGRAHHGIRKFGAWWRIHEVVRSISVGNYIPVPGDLSDVVIEEAGAFLREVIVPSAQALALLNRRRNHSASDFLLRCASEAQRLFQRVHRLAARVGAGQVPAREFEEAWSELRRATLLTSVDGLFCQNWRCVIGEQMSESGGAIDRTLPEVLQEPTGLVLHMIRNELGGREIFKTSISVSGAAPYELEREGQLDDHFEALHAAWGVAARIPIVWDLSEPLRRMLRIIAGNIRHHGASPLGLRVDFIYDEEAARLRFSNRRAGVRREGARTGLRDLGTLAAENNCVIDIADDAEELFWVELRVPMKWLYLPRLI